MVLGLVMGTVGGYLLNSNKGRKMTEQVKNKIADELSRLRDISKEKYRELVDKTIETYERSKEISKEEAAELREELEEKYDKIKSALK